MRGLLQGHVLDRVEALAAQFRDAAPFPHVVIDGFLRDEAVAALLDEFPPFDRGNCRTERGERGLKSTFEAVAGLGPSFAAVDTLLRSPDFLSTLGQITGIGDLLFDPHYVGGGTHENRARQELDPHVDFNYHPVTGWHRRLNLILYLNPGWEEAWGGCLELHSDPWRPERDSVRTIAPLLNRCVIFETSERSWHGFLPVSPPASMPDLSRRSLAVYFYTRQRPAAETAPSHATVYVERPVPSIGGRVLDEATIDEVSVRLSRRHQHAERLQQREQAFTTQARQLLTAALIPGEMPDPEIASALSRLAGLQDEALEALYRREKAFAALLDTLRGRSAPFGLAGLSLVQPPLGCWDDGWAGRVLHVRLRAARSAPAVEIHGTLPEAAGATRTLSIAVNGVEQSHRVSTGPFACTIRGPIAAGAIVDVDVRADSSFSPRARGLSDDGRDLAWVVRRMAAVPA